MCVTVYVCLSVCMYVRMLVCIHAGIRTYVRTYVRNYVSMYVCMYACMHLRMSAPRLYVRPWLSMVANTLLFLDFWDYIPSGDIPETRLQRKWQRWTSCTLHGG